MVTKGSAAGVVAKRPDHLLPEGRGQPPKGQQQLFVVKTLDHLLPEGRRWPPKGQQWILQQRDQITDKLRAGDGHQRISSRFYSKETKITYNLRARDGHQRVSNRSAAKRPDH